MPSWPVSLPDCMVRDDLEWAPQDNAVRFAPEVGAQMTRRRGTAAPQAVSGSLRPLTSSQWTTLFNFWKDDLKSGSLSFDWKHPVTYDACVMQFSAPPRGRAVGPKWRVSLSLLILP